MIRNYGFSTFWPFLGFEWFIKIIVWVLFGLLVAKSVHFLFFKDQTEEFSEEDNGSDDTALDILKKRYAKGEITKKQFDSMKKDIK